jgi:hypothetical protein
MVTTTAPMTCETPGLSRPGVSCAVAESELSCEGEFHSRSEKGRTRGHNTVTVALKGRYSNRPPDKAVVM